MAIGHVLACRSARFRHHLPPGPEPHPADASPRRLQRWRAQLARLGTEPGKLGSRSRTPREHRKRAGWRPPMVTTGPARPTPVHTGTHRYNTGTTPVSTPEVRTPVHTGTVGGFP